MLVGILSWLMFTCGIGALGMVAGVIIAIFECDNWYVFKDAVKTIGIICLVIALFPLSLVFLAIYRFMVLWKTRE